MKLPFPPALPPPSDLERASLDSWRVPRARAPNAGQPPDGAFDWLQRNALWVAALWTALVVAVTLVLAALQPSMGVQLMVRGAQVQVAAVAPGGPAEAAGVRAGMRLRALSSPADGRQVVLEPADLIEDPDLFDTYAEWQRFYARQDQLAAMLRAGPLQLSVQAPDAQAPSTLSLRAADGRPLRQMPLAFWFHLLVQLAGVMAAGWVISVYPPQRATHCSALGGIMLTLSIASAGVFSTRELALTAPLFHGLSVLNHVAAIVALLAMAGVVSYFPTALRGGTGWPPALVLGAFALWALADSAWWLPSPAWAGRTMLVAGALLVLLQMGRQWRATASNVLARAAVRALSGPWLLGLTGLIGLQEGLLLLGARPPLSQTFLYVMVVVMATGGALALRHVRAFDLDTWLAQTLLVWGMGVGMLLGYRLLHANTQLNDDMALLMVLLIFGVGYLPLSLLVWRRRLLDAAAGPRDLASGILALGLTSPAERAQLWAHLLDRCFRAQRLDLRPGPPNAAMPPESAVLAGGRALWVPPVADLPGVMLWYRDLGARFFTRADRRLAQRLLALAGQIVQARQAYVLGASDERERIADDLHDDLGAKLLSLVHASARPDAGTEMTRLAREALEEMRLSVRHLKAQPVSADDVLADWRAEAVSRLSAVGVEVDWDAQSPEQVLLLPARLASQLTRVLREALSNIIRHSGATHCRVQLVLTERELRVEIEDNGRGLDASAVAASAGLGLPNIERRVRRLGGTHRFAVGALGGTLLMARVPLEHGAAVGA